MSIGALSAATGVPVTTIRTWERRYGFPVAERKPSGHRVYPVKVVQRLRLISDVLARGHRAAEVVPASERELAALLAAHPAAIAAAPARPTVSLDNAAEMFAAVRAFDATALQRAFEMEWAHRGPLEFLEQRAAPFMKSIGNAWENGSIEVRHEHFASACLGDFLRAVRIPLEDRLQGPVIALTTLPHERHGLGLHMAALVCALTGWKPLVLGVDTPADQLAKLAREHSLAGLALSCVLPVPEDALKELRNLRRRLPRALPLLAGGAGAAGIRISGVEVLPDLRALEAWLRDRRRDTDPLVRTSPPV